MDKPPNHMTKIAKIFSETVFAETFPKPTVVKLLNVKYNAVRYRSVIDGPLTLMDTLKGR